MNARLRVLDFVHNKIVERDAQFFSLLQDGKESDAEYLAWLKTQPCKNCGKVPYGEYLTIPAHVRRVAKGSGSGCKPPWNATSLCNDCHQTQHQKGESALGGKEQMDAWATESLSLYIVEKLWQQLGDQWFDCFPWLKSEGEGNAA
jgi:hypothetical protein